MIHASSVAVSREHRRAETDRLDTELLKRGLHTVPVLERDANPPQHDIAVAVHPSRTFIADPDKPLHCLGIMDRRVCRPILEPHQVTECLGWVGY